MLSKSPRHNQATGILRPPIGFQPAGTMNRWLNNNARRRNPVCRLWSRRREHRHPVLHRSVHTVPALISTASNIRGRKRWERSVWSPRDAVRFDENHSCPIIDSWRGSMRREARRAIWRWKQFGDSSVRQIDNAMTATDRVAELANHAVRKLIEVMHTNWTHRPANVPLPVRSCADVTTNRCG